MNQNKHKILLSVALFFSLAVLAFADFRGDAGEIGLTYKAQILNIKALARDTSMFETYSTTGTAKTIRQLDSGKTYIMGEVQDDPTTFNLPDARAGLEFTFVDNDATAAADMTINPKDGDQLNGGTAGVSYNATGDAAGETLTIRAISATQWVIIGYRGTWASGA